MRILILLVAASLAYTKPVHACSCVGAALHRTDPQDGAVDVPRNQALVIEGAFVPTSVRLENERGEPVPFELNAGPWPGCEGTSADVIPKAPLDANARYTLRVEAMYPDASEAATVQFTTGSALIPEISLAPPQLSASVVHDAPAAMCGIASTVFACIGTRDTSDVELIIRRGQTILMRTTTLVLDDATYSLPEVPDCIELRRRSRTGARSAPVSICGDALGARAWSPADSEDFISCHDGVIGDGAPKKDGCTLGSRGATPSSAALLFAAVFLFRRRRRGAPSKLLYSDRRLR